MFNPSRSQAREFLFGLWEKHRAGAALTPQLVMELKNSVGAPVVG